MAQKVVVELVSDLSGEAGDETLTFALDGVTYEMDLTEKEATKARALFAPYVAAGRKVRSTSSAPKSRGGARSSNSEFAPADVRAFAEANGIEISKRGRISADIVEKYRASLAGH